MKYRSLKGYKYELLETEEFQTGILGTRAKLVSQQKHYADLWESGRLVIYSGYCWDGASGPTFDTKSSMRGTLPHDTLYQFMRKGLLDRKRREDADKLMRDIFIEDGMWGWRANLWYWAVRKLGKSRTFPEKKPRGEIIEI